MKDIQRSQTITWRSSVLLLPVLCSLGSIACADPIDIRLTDLPSVDTRDLAAVEGDWLVMPMKDRATVYRGKQKNDITMMNGLIRRTWRLKPRAFHD